MNSQLPNWAKTLIGALATLGVGYGLVETSSIGVYPFAGIAILIGGGLFGKKERAYAYGIFAAVAVVALMVALAIIAFAKNLH